MYSFLCLSSVSCSLVDYNGTFLWVVSGMLIDLRSLVSLMMMSHPSDSLTLPSACFCVSFFFFFLCFLLFLFLHFLKLFILPFFLLSIRFFLFSAFVMFVLHLALVSGSIPSKRVDPVWQVIPLTTISPHTHTPPSHTHTLIHYTTLHHTTRTHSTLQHTICLH